MSAYSGAYLAMAPKNQLKMRAGTKPATIQAVRQMISSRIENKLIVGTNSGNTVVAGTMIYKSIVAQDDTISGRSGDKIIPSHLSFHFTIQDTANAFVRLILFQDTSNNGAPPGVTDVLSSGAVQAEYNPANHLAKRFKILYDKNFDLSSTGQQVMTVVGSIKMRLPMYFIGTGATSADGGKNSLYAIVIGGATTTAYTLTSSLQYTDA